MNGKGDAVTKRRLPVPDMTSDEFQDELTPEHLKETVRRGSKKLDMPAFGESYFTEEQLDALVVHVRGFKGE